METGKKAVIKVKFRSTLQRLTFWNGMIGLTPKELEVLATLIDTDGELCGTDNRKLSCAGLGISREVLNTYIKRLKSKKALNSSKGTYSLHNIFNEWDRMEIVILREEAS